MPDGLRVNADDYRRFFEKTKGLDKKVRNQVRKRIRESARLIAPTIVREGAEPLPSGGGLSAAVAAGGKPTISQTSSGVRMVLGKKKGPQIGRMNDGELRHPVFYVWHQKKSGEWILSDPDDRKSWKWVPQHVPVGTFTAAFKDHSKEVREAVRKEMVQILRELKV